MNLLLRNVAVQHLFAEVSERTLALSAAARSRTYNRYDR
jgi:hypothetical protein